MADLMVTTSPLVVGPVLVASLAACSSGATETTSAPAAPSTASRSSSTAPTDPAMTTSAPAASMSTPAKSAGPLDRRSVPKALDLGRGWKPYTDPGDPEAGYLGSGSWVRARGVSEVVAGIVPLGCLKLTAPPRLPVPAHALEATYRGRGDAPAVALVLDYATPAAAAAMLTGLTRIARSCPAPATPVAHDDPLTVVVQAEHIDASTVLDRRREYGEGASEWMWSEAVVRRGTRVGLLIVASHPAGQAPDLRDLASRLRASVVR
ncbi:MAG: hypothetical protein ACXV3V_12440 [Actinomycetes bacterium]